MISVKVEFDAKSLQAQLDKIPVLAQLAALDAGIRPAAKVLQKRVKELTPDSRQSGSKDKWSKKTKSERSGERPLRDLVAIKVLKPKNNTAAALVGFEWPAGNKVHFLVPMKKETRKKVLWGKVTGTEVRKGDDFLRRAFDETKAAQSDAFVSGVQKAIDRKIKDLGIG